MWSSPFRHLRLRRDRARVDPGLHPERIVGIADDARVRMLFFDLSFTPLVEEISPRLARAMMSSR